MRLSGVEAVSRSPASGGGAYSIPAPSSLDFGAGSYGGGDPASAAFLSSANFGMPSSVEAAESLVASGYEAAGFGSVLSGNPYMQPSMSSTAPPAITPAHLAASSAANAACAAAMSSENSVLDEEGKRLGRAIDAKLSELVPAIHAASVVQAAQTAPASMPPTAMGEAPPIGSGVAHRMHGSHTGGAAALRISRQELDTRVQQILGRHGQALSELGTPPPK